MTEQIDRREFSVRSLMALLAGVSVSVTACGGADSPTAPGPGADGDVAGRISDNHGHTASVTAVEIGAGNAVTLEIRGNADHSHRVDLDRQDIQQIGSGQRISRRSSNDASHFHEVTFN